MDLGPSREQSAININTNEQFPSCDAVPVGHCSQCIGAYINRVGAGTCSYNKKTGECTSFPDSNTTRNCSDVPPLPRPPGPQPNPHPGQTDNDECYSNDDCSKQKGGQCKYNGDYKSPQRKCYYPCTSNRQCDDLGGQCLKTGYCGISDQPVNPWLRPIEETNPEKEAMQKKMQESMDLQEKMLEDIQNLQNLEQYLIRMLSNPNLTPEEKDETMKKIENLTEMRINMYKNLKQMNSIATPIPSATIGDQQTAVDIMEEELNKLKKTVIENDQTRMNKIRLIEINNYYSSRYKDHTEVLKTGLVFLILFVVLFALKSRQLLPDVVYSALKYILVIATVYFLGSKVVSMWMRDNMNYSEYDWNFNPKTAPAPTGTSTKFTFNTFLSGLGFSTCPA
jgi:hypothetical protein